METVFYLNDSKNIKRVDFTFDENGDATIYFQEKYFPISIQSGGKLITPNGLTDLQKFIFANPDYKETISQSDFIPPTKPLILNNVSNPFINTDNQYFTQEIEINNIIKNYMIIFKNI